MRSRSQEKAEAAGGPAEFPRFRVIVTRGLAELAAPLGRRLVRSGGVSVTTGADASCGEIVEQAARAAAAIVLLPDADADALMCSEMPGIIGGIPILVVGDAGEQRALKLARAGFAGVVGRRSGTAMIAKAVAALMSGEMWFSRGVLSVLLRDLRKASRAPELTVRERDILRLMSAGLKNRMIAAELGISHETVRWHIRRLNAKLEARGASESDGNAGNASGRRAAAASGRD